MSRVFTSRMKEITEKIDPYILSVSDTVEWKPNTPDHIKELYAELKKINKEQHKLETSMMF